MVLGLRPYREGNVPLWRLHRFDIQDKHKLLTTVGMAYRSLALDAGKMMTKRFPNFHQEFGEAPSPPIALRPADRAFPLRDGVELFNEPVDDHSMEPSFNFELAIGAEELGEIPVNELLPPLVVAVDEALHRLEEC